MDSLYRRCNHYPFFWKGNGALKMNFPEKFRIAGLTGESGVFEIPIEHNVFRVIASNQKGWNHVSVSIKNRPRCPLWNEMNAIKDCFFSEEETIVQFHPKKSEYVNIHPYVLHLWRQHGVDYTLPPKDFV